MKTKNTKAIKAASVTPAAPITVLPSVAEVVSAAEDSIPGIVDTTSGNSETAAQRHKRDCESLRWAMSIKTVSLSDYVAQGKTDEERASRKKEWNKAKAVINRISAASIDSKTVSHDLRIKLNGNHSIRGKAKPLDNTPAEIVAEELKRERLKAARAILDSGTGASGILSHGLTAQQLEDLAHCAKQDGHVREPHTSCLFRPREAILTLNEKGNLVADRKACMRWIEWRDVEIMTQQDSVAEEIKQQMESAAA